MKTTKFFYLFCVLIFLQSCQQNITQEEQLLYPDKNQSLLDYVTCINQSFQNKQIKKNGNNGGSNRGDVQTVLTADAEGANTGGREGLTMGISLGSTIGPNGAMIMGAIGSAIGAAVYGAHASIQAWIDLPETPQSSDCTGYSVLRSKGGTYFWNPNKISAIMPINMEWPQEDLADCNIYNVVGVCHNILIQDMFSNFSQSQIIQMPEEVRLEYIQTSFENNIAPHLQNVGIPNTNGTLTDEQIYQITDLAHECINTYLQLNQVQRIQYYDTLLSTTRQLVSSMDCELEAGLLFMNTISTLHYSSKLWRTFTPNREINYEYIALNPVQGNSLIWTNRSTCPLSVLEEDYPNVVIGIPVYENEELDRIYFFANSTEQNINNWSTLEQNLNDDYIYIHNLNNISNGYYPILWNADNTALCIFTSIDSKL